MLIKRGIFSNALGIDLGTANTLIFLKDKGIVLREPSVVAINKETKKIVAVGKNAKKKLGLGAGDIEVIRPMKGGVVADPVITEYMLREFFNKVIKRSFLTHLSVVIAVPYGITGVEKHALMDAAYRAGASHVETIPEPMASALGIGLPVGEDEASMVVDIGGGTTEIAILSVGEIAYAKSIRVGGDKFDSSIIDYVKRTYNLFIGERTAEETKMKIGSAAPLGEELTLEVRGRDVMSSLAKSLYLTSQEIREKALMENFRDIADAVRTAFEHCPPELAADLVDRGIALAGGGSQIPGIDKLLSDATGIPVFCSDDPLCAVVNGTGRSLEDNRWLAH